MPAREGTFLSGWAVDHPTARLTNDELVDRFDTTHEWLEQRIGIVERRKLAPEVSAAQLAAPTAAAAIEHSGSGPSDVDLIIGAASFDDFGFPSLGARVGSHLGLSAHAFDVKAACTGWLVGLDVAESFLATGKAERILVVASEKSDLGIDPTDRSSVPFFGDAAVAAVVQAERPSRGLEVLAMHRRSEVSMHDAVEWPIGGWFQMDAGRTRRWVEDAIARAAKELLDESGLVVGDLRALVCHQANLRLIQRIAGDLGIEADRHWHNVEWAGNTAAAGAPSALFDGLAEHEHDLVDGDPILMISVGSGLNVVGALLRWIDDPAT
ncbi:MAG: ketoacyl-ACP synthase III [Acidimicrobiales bacterium]|nr:ketoacyl-ACP synthase III [Acidimicrobiales bacterium]